MKAIILKDFGSTDELIYEEIINPVPKEDEVLVSVRAVGINPVDAKTRKGKGQALRIKEDRPMILGWDISGVVAEVGAGVATFKKGDEVFGMINIPGHGKAYAEFVAAKASHLALKPKNVSHEEAAATGIAAITAWQALMVHAQVKAGQRVLIQAASGGVGHYAVQIAKAQGVYVVGSSSPENKDFVLSLGADQHLNYKNSSWDNEIEAVDIVLEAIGGDNIDRSLRVLKPGGIIISLPSGLSEDVGEKAARQGKQGIFFMVKSNQDDLQHISSMLADGTLRPHISQVFEFSEIKAAHTQIETGKTRGKIVLKL